MFISKTEKLGMQNRIAALEKSVALLLQVKADLPVIKQSSGWSDAAKAKHSERMKKMWADRKSGVAQ